MSVAMEQKGRVRPEPTIVRAKAVDLIQFTGELADWIARYTARLDTERASVLAGEHETMHRMAMVYDERSGQLVRLAPDIERMLPGEAAALKGETARLRKNLAACAAKLKAKYTVGEWLIRAVGEEVTKRSHPVQRYDRGAALHRGPAQASAPPLAINRTI